MVNEKDTSANSVVLKMEAYKSINRELTAKNQELLQCVGALREEILMTKQKIMEQREEKQHIKKTIIDIITKSFNQIIKLLYTDNTENDVSSSISFPMSTLKNLMDETTSQKRSNQIKSKADVVSFLSQKNTSFGNQHSHSPLAEIERNPNVTYRSRRDKEKGVLQSISKSQYGREFDEEFEEETDNVREGCEFEMSDQLLPAITEEAIAFTQSGFVYSNEESSTDHESDPALFNENRSLRRKRSKYESGVATELQNSFRLLNAFPSSSCVESGRYRFTESNTELPHAAQEVTLDDTSFNSLSLKAKSSTPYRVLHNAANDSKVARNLKVVIPKLKLDTLSRLGISVESTAMSDKIGFNSKENSKKLSCMPKGVKHAESDEIKTEKREDNIRGRPKRKAAESARSTLIEPTLKTKLRRQL